MAESEQNTSADNLDDSNVVTLADVIEQEKELEMEYVAVLGASDEKFCTYSKGYIKRQALYSCLTCKADSRHDPEQRAGVCLACSYKCHEGHEMVELYTKRNFRCDCGTRKFPGIKCNLDRLKFDENTENLYNQNFSGTYCTCHRPYPDPEDPIDDEMIQCVVCEDWFHCRHLGVTVPSMNQFTEMICAECTEKHSDILLHYREVSVFSPSNNEEAEDVNMSKSSNETTSEDTAAPANKQEPISKDEDDGLKNEINKCIMDIIEINKNKLGEEEEPAAKRQKLELDSTEKCDNTVPSTDDVQSTKEQCKKPPLSTRQYNGASFWPTDWRTEICQCSTCLDDLKKQKIAFLADLDDTVLAYEEKGIAKANRESESEPDREMKLLQRLNHTQKIDVIMGYNKMKDDLKEFLHAFVASKQVVTEEDIHRFFRMFKEKNEGNKKEATK